MRLGCRCVFYDDAHMCDIQIFKIGYESHHIAVMKRFFDGFVSEVYGFYIRKTVLAVAPFDASDRKSVV